MKYIVRLYYSGYCTHEVEADDEDEAFQKASQLPIDLDEVSATLEEWEDAAEVELVEP